MGIEDLFVSYKQVEPVKFTVSHVEQPQPIYINAERVKQVINNPETDQELSSIDDISNWKVKTFGQKIYNNSDWKKIMTNAYRKLGLNDNAIKNLIAKNALESNWGKSAQGAYNYGNITTGSKWTGSYVNGKDKNSKGERISQKFRSYNNVDEFVQDEIDLLTRIYGFNQNDDFDTFINKLQGNNKGNYRYAEATDYVDRVRNVYNSI